MTAPPALRLRLLVAAVVAAAAIVAGVAVVLGNRAGGAPSGVATSTDPASFVLPRLDGPGSVRLADHRGHPVVVDFFASWCTACEGEIPGYVRVGRRLQGRVDFIGVDSLETGDGLAMARRLGAGSWPLARDVDGIQSSGLHDALHGVGMPITAFYDAAGRLQEVAPGALTEDELSAVLHRLDSVG